MARTTKPLKPGRGGRIARPAGATRTAKTGAATRRTNTTATAPAPKVSKGELRDRVAALEAANVRLRGKNRELGRAAKSATARAEALEAQLAAHERQRTRPGGATATTRRPRTRAHPVDPGDAAPPSAAVETPHEPDEEAEAAQDSVEEHFPDG